jgi:MFS family permease
VEGLFSRKKYLTTLTINHKNSFFRQTRVLGEVCFYKNYRRTFLILEVQKNLLTRSLAYIVTAASAGTIIEWYDFYIFGSLAVILSGKFFPSQDPVAGFLLTLATFATGFAVRPIGAVIFGRIGDTIGRRYAFLLTITLMGSGTCLIGVLPTYNMVGILAPLLLVTLRLLQGLALGGEYGGAAIYVAEHVPDKKRGYWTSFIQTTATGGLILSLGVILSTRMTLGENAFGDWGWRIPFIVSILMIGAALFIRWRMKETPLFSAVKEMGKASKAPLRESFTNRKNVKLILIALFGAVTGEAVIWYTSQFYTLYFLQTVLKVGFVTSSSIMLIAVTIATPFFVFFGWLSDKVGRKKIVLLGCLLGAVTLYPIYLGITTFANPLNFPALVALVVLLMIYTCMVYGPLAAFLVELFPAKIRYTSLSVPYHIGNGLFGGFTPLIATALVLATKNMYAGLSWPIAIAALTFGIGMVALRETKHTKIWDETKKDE